MIVLVDHDNVIEVHRRQGPLLLVDRIRRAITKANASLGSRLHVRFYGGWYDAAQLSQRAQLLSSGLLRDFPTILQLGGGSAVPATAELALSLDVDPATHFHHTFRRQSPPLDVRCHDPRAMGCGEAKCPLVQVHEFLRTGTCPVASCARTAENMLFRSSQKLVDSMLAVDLVTLATRRADSLAVVSSDDDVWPALHAVLHLGTSVVQVHTKPGAILRHPYVRPGRAGYVPVEM